jgi:hypothetical protein
MVTTSRNRIGISLSKCIRHGLVAIINGKRRMQDCEALDWILADYSCARRPPVPIASPCHFLPHPAWPGEARRASARVCFFLSHLLHTLTSA